MEGGRELAFNSNNDGTTPKLVDQYSSLARDGQDTTEVDHSSHLVCLVYHLMGVGVQVTEEGGGKPGGVSPKVFSGWFDEGVVSSKHHVSEGPNAGHTATREVTSEGTCLGELIILVPGEDVE